MVQETVGVSRRVPGLPHPRQIRRKAAPVLLHVGNDVAPQIGRTRISVQEDDRVTVPFIHIAYLGVEDGRSLARMRIGRTDRRVH